MIAKVEAKLSKEEDQSLKNQNYADVPVRLNHNTKLRFIMNWRDALVCCGGCAWLCFGALGGRR
jgi:hypothetical protein